MQTATTPRIRFFHNGKEGQKGGTSIGYQLLDKEGNKMIVSFARCSDHPTSTDVYSKKKSRWICEGRLRQGKKIQIVEKPANMDRYEFFLGLIKEHDKKVKERRTNGKKTT